VTRRPTDAELAFVAGRRVAHLATTSTAGKVTLHPFCFALVAGADGPEIVTALDEKPKAVGDRQLGRVRDILERPEVAIVADEYQEDWTRLAWVHLRGSASLLEPRDQGHSAAVTALRAKYSQYVGMGLEDRPVIRIEIQSGSSWSGTGLEGPLPRPGDLAAVVRGRRSVRAFSPAPVPRDAIEEAIAAAGWAPSPHGRQPWRFAVVESSDRRLALADAMAATWRDQLNLDGQPAEVAQHRLERSRERLITAPVLVVPCLYLADLDVYPDAARQEAERTMAIQSLGAAVQNFLLTVYAAGLDSGWMCAPLFCPEIVRETLGLAAELTPHALLPVGFAAKDPVRRPRRAVGELIVSWQ
jgi:coenzyme F420-0:L-glutamate ligase/coenzyme F420-1:gamma-L-glutamate ligase